MLITLVIGLLVLIVGLAMVLGAAFRRRLLAGFTVIVLPVVYPLYALFNWSNASIRNGFLTSLAGALIVSAAIYGGVIKELPFSGAREVAAKLPTALPPDGPLPNAAAANAINALSGAAFDPLADERYLAPAKPLAPNDDKQVMPAVSANVYAYYALPFDQAGRQVGKMIRIVTREGKTAEGTLVGGDARSLLLETTRRGGSVAFAYRTEDLVAIFIYDHEPPQVLLAPVTGDGEVQYDRPPSGQASVLPTVEEITSSSVELPPP